MSKKQKNKQFQFDIALSFAGEDRDYVEKVAKQLEKMAIRVFYDKYEAAELWGKNLYDHLEDVYKNKARFTVIFISKHYAKKAWTNHERKSAQARSFKENIEYILPARFDKTEIPGILPTIGYIDLKDYSPEKLAELIKQKNGHIMRYEYFPADPDLLFKKIKAENDKQKKDIHSLAYKFFCGLKLMTIEERRLLITAVINGCPAGPPKNIHLDINYLSRLTSTPINEIKSSFVRLDCLGYVTRVYDRKKHGNTLCNEKNIIEIKYIPLLEGIAIENATFVIDAIMQILCDNFCENCVITAIDNLDFSILNSLVGFPEPKTSNTV